MSGAHRIEQLQSTLRKAVQEVLARGINDPRAKGMMSVTDVRLSRDLRQATILVSVYPEKHQELSLHAIQSAAKYIRREAGELVSLERMPELTFRLDVSLKKQAELLEALSKAKRASDSATPGEDPASDTKEGGR